MACPPNQCPPKKGESEGYPTGDYHPCGKRNALHTSTAMAVNIGG